MNENEYKLDDLDKKIISIIQNKPEITHSEVAKIVNRSQPTIGTRLKRIKKTGFLQIQSGVNFKKVSFNLVSVSINTNSPKTIMEMAKACPFMLNAFRLSGIFNVMVLLAHSSLKKLYNVIDQHFRSNPDVQMVSMSVVSDIADNFVHPLVFNSGIFNPNFADGCSENCHYCMEKGIMKFGKT
ncbi:MAG: Lrp/AsnC family transcriptional regulator [Candidatus Hodarchaeales archaeon]|jgi:DNA-binding Lrp family transcriptional regulator